eukprot:CAMPEP_0179145126 /NCGR_PEP_ID=MMETSP0796-20121207/69988_1 /TAXON_ID=73915 /ORGANISM="Pyrodinium bahamense, Strain pbaha01" /LENGTH=121 /DNA_ID=CAMNT_0020845465 /DNA_START=81 /DNA_END=443 /DNA_ORIENTATION=+
MTAPAASSVHDELETHHLPKCCNSTDMWNALFPLPAAGQAACNSCCFKATWGPACTVMEETGGNHKNGTASKKLLDQRLRLKVKATGVRLKAPSDDCAGHRCDISACPCGCECGTDADPGL